MRLCARRVPPFKFEGGFYSFSLIFKALLGILSELVATNLLVDIARPASIGELGGIAPLGSPAGIARPASIGPPPPLDGALVHQAYSPRSALPGLDFRPRVVDRGIEGTSTCPAASWTGQAIVAVCRAGV